MLYLVRHGRTAVNAEGRLQGRLNPPIDELGQRQAQAMAAFIGRLTVGDGGIAEVVASPLERAQQTAAYFERPVVTDDRWIEIHYGQYEGAELSDVPPAVWQRWYTEPDFAVVGGESFAALISRVESSLAELAERAVDNNIVVVSHVSPIKAAVAWTLGADFDIMFRCHLSYAALCQVGFGRFGPVLHSFNRIVDLEPPE